MRKLLAPAAALLIVAGFGGAAGQGAAYGSAQRQAQNGAVVRVAKTSLGEILVDKDGMTLYLFERDKYGQPTCYGDCAKAWPPYLTQGAPKAEQGAKPDLLKTVKRKDGYMQVVYGQWPLYSFQGDKKAGDVKGNDVDAFGAEWYALTAQGKKAE